MVAEIIAGGKEGENILQITPKRKCISFFQGYISPSHVMYNIDSSGTTAPFTNVRKNNPIIFKEEL